MARARYYVEGIGANGRQFDYTYYHVTPAFFLAREPTDQEKLHFIDTLAQRYNPRVLAARPYKCFNCERPAKQLVHCPTYALHDPAALAVNNVLLAVCPASSCHAKANTILDLNKSLLAQKFGLPSVGPEMLMCANCCKLGEARYPRCGRCKAPPYCSVECQKANWKKHKPHCTGRVETMQLSTEELDQIDKDASEFTHGTEELSHMNHTGGFPEEAEKLGLGTELTGFGADKAKQRAKAVREVNKRLNDPNNSNAASEAPLRTRRPPTQFAMYNYFEYNCNTQAYFTSTLM